IGFPRLGDPVDDAADLLALGGRRQDRVFGPGRQVFAQAIGPGEESGAFKDDVDPQGLPGQLGRVPFAQIFNGLSRHLQGLAGCGHPMPVAAVNGIVIEQVGQIIKGHQVVDRHQLQLRSLQNNFKSRPADPSHAVDCDLGHTPPPRETVIELEVISKPPVLALSPVKAIRASCRQRRFGNNLPVVIRYYVPGAPGNATWQLFYLEAVSSSLMAWGWTPGLEGPTTRLNPRGLGFPW